MDLNLDGYHFFGLGLIIVAVFGSIASGSSWGKRHPVIRRGFFYTLTAVVLFTYTFLIVINTVKGEKTADGMIIALLSKLGELLIIPVALEVFQSKQATNSMTEKVVTTTTTKVELEDGSVVEQVRVVERTGETPTTEKPPKQRLWARLHGCSKDK